MTQEIFIANINYLVTKDVSVKKTNEENANMRQTVANTFADLNYSLSDEDIIFIYSLSEDKVKLDPDDPDNKVTTLDKIRVGVYTKNDLFIEFVYQYNLNGTYVSEISKRSIKNVQPSYRNVGGPDKVVDQFEEIEHLSFKISDYKEAITLYNHQHSGNKSIKEIYIDFIERLK